MSGNPGFGVIHWNKNTPSVEKAAFHDAAIDEEKQNGHPASQGRLGPVARPGEVIFEVEASVTESFLGERLKMLVIVMAAVTGKSVGPLQGEVANS